MSMNRRNGLIVFGGAGLLLMLLLGLVFGPGVIKVIAAPPSPDFACADMQEKATFLAYSQNTKGDNFGPVVNAANVGEAQAELHARRCIDPALVTAHAAFYGVDGLSLPMSQQAFEDAVKAAKKEPATVWRSRIEAVEAYEKTGELSITTSTKRYDTLFFREGDKKSVVPTLYAGPVRDKVSTLFTVRHGDVVKKLKLECGFQPFEQDFPGTPGKPKPPTTTPTTPPATRPPTTPPATLTPKDPSKDVNVNKDVPEQVRGPGTTPVGGDPGPAEEPVDSDTGCDGACTNPSAPAPSPAASTPPSGGGPTQLPAPTEAPVTPTAIASDPPVATSIATPPPG